MDKKIIFYMPGCYTLFKRMTTSNKRQGLLCYHIVPILYLYFLGHSWSIVSLLSCCLFVIAFYSQYEIGYIYNDTETIKLEYSPSERLDEGEIQYYEGHKTGIYLNHILSFVVGFALLWLLGEQEEFLIYSFCVMIAEISIFLGYNNVRGKKSLPLFFLLELFKYLPFVWLFHANHIVAEIIIISLIYAVPNTIERLSFKRYGITWMNKLLPTKNSFSKFRVIFYFVTCLLLVLSKDFLQYLPLFLFLLTFRCLVILKLKREIKK